jgi:hypothetical protein
MMKNIVLTTFLAFIMTGYAFGQDQTVTITTTGQGENLQQATDNALRSAIEQTFGTFISSRTEILDDELVSDQIASVASGNIQSYDVLAQTRISASLWGVTVRSVVSVTKLTSFVQARGVRVEIQGGLFAANIRQQDLNEKAEVEAVRNMVGVLHELFQTSFDYSIEAGNPVATDATNQNWTIPLTIRATTNDNMVLAAAYFQGTMQAISLTPIDVLEYKRLNKDVYSVILTNLNERRRNRRTNFSLRKSESFEMIEKLIDNLRENYHRSYAVHSGLDRKIGLGAMIREFSLYKTDQRNKRHEIILLDADRQYAIFKYNDQRTLNEINRLTGYTVQPLGVTSRDHLNINKSGFF